VATSTVPIDVPFTAGEVTAPAANTRLANTGALVAGQYNLTIAFFAGEGNSLRIRRRNAADGADIWSQRIVIGNAMWISPFQLRVVLAASEFVVIENVSAGTAGTIYQASIWVQGPF
jgi:hypothetical protein